MRMRNPVVAILVGFGLIAVSACGSATGESSSVQPGSQADVDYVLSTLGANYERVRDPFGPTSLQEAVPRPPSSTAQGAATPASTDLLLIGTVVEVSKGQARKYTSEDEYEVVEFDDPEAHERTALVTVQVDTAVAPFGPRSVDKQTFRVGLAGAEDPDRFLSGLRGMGEVVVLLAEVRDGRNQGTLYPIMAGAAMGEVSPDGALSFPAMGEDAESFMGKADTIGELKQRAISTSSSGDRENPVG